MSQTHEYHANVNWNGGKDGSGELSFDGSGHVAPLAVPLEFQGTGNGTNPEEMLTGAVASCYSITFGIIASNRKLPIISLKTKAIGEVEQAGMQFTFKKITILPTVVLDSSATDDQIKAAEDMAHKADLYCIITNAVRGKVEIAVEPSISRA